MKFIEELACGDCFTINNESFIITTDFKRNNNRLCVSLKDGFTRWFESSTMVEPIQIYKLDKDNNIIPFKETVKDDITQNTNVS